MVIELIISINWKPTQSKLKTLTIKKQFSKSFLLIIDLHTRYKLD